MIKIIRYSTTKTDTLGFLFIGDDFFCYTLEDGFNEQKVKGETRIPEGIYKLKLRKEETPLTKEYREKFSWFKFHIELENVPEFNYVYIHIGNDHTDTKGCILLGNIANNNQIKEAYIYNSTDAFERFYKKIYPLLEKGEQITIQITELQ